MRACAEPKGVLELLETASGRLRRMVQFDGAAWFGADPATLLATSPVRVENVEPGHCESYWQREFLVEDALLYRDLARAPQPAATLYPATDGHPARSGELVAKLFAEHYGPALHEPGSAVAHVEF